MKGKRSRFSDRKWDRKLRSINAIQPKLKSLSCEALAQSNEPFVRKFRVTSREKGQRLLAFLRENCPDAPSVKTLKRNVEKKQCKINGRVETFSTRILKEGDLVEIEMITEQEARPRLVMLWEDEHLIAYDKPPGVVCDSHYFRSKLIHRLDKETSGVVLAAKDDKTLEQMIELFRKKQVEKEYLAIVDGIVTEKKKRISSKLAPRHHFQGQTVYASSHQGQEAITEWEVVSTGTKASLLLCRPITGRTHQLRVHLKEAGHPILGDYQYAKVFYAPFAAKRHLLHAYHVVFPHPVTQEKKEIIAPVPAEFILALEALGMAHSLELFHTEKQQSRRNP